MVRVQGLKPKPNHLRPNSKVWFSNLAELNSKFSLGFGKSVRGLPDYPVPPPFLIIFSITFYFSAIISNLPRCLSTLRDLPKTIADHRDHRRSSQEAALPCTASPGFATAAFQIWEAWYYTWSLVYTHSALTKVP